MIVRYGSGSEGIKEYLEEGKKQGRELSRDELDKRVVLEGDLDICDKIIQSRDTNGKRYDHISLSFKERDISEDTMRAIVADYKAFLLAAYGENELYFYAEAHMPRTATEEVWNAETKQWETVARWPHIHIVIPRTNLVTGERSSPLELLPGKYATKDATMEFANAFQEHINAKYGLVSPKDSRRHEFAGKSDILSRAKGDVFNGRNREALKMIRNRMLDERIESPQAFRDMLKTMGKVSIGNRGKPNQYLKILLPGEDQNVRLDHYQFSSEFLALPMDKKLAFYEHKLAQADAEERALRAKVYAELLAKWPERAMEIKYLSPSSRFFKEFYSKATDEEKRFVLDKLEAEHYARLKEEFGYVREGALENEVAAGLEHVERGPAGRMEVSTAITRNLGESSRNFAALAVNPGIDANAVRERLSGVAENAIEREFTGGIRGRASGRDDHRVEGVERGGLEHGDRRETDHRAVGDNLRAADANHRVLAGDRRDFWEAALANRTSIECDATARRFEAYGNGKLNSVYLRTIAELRKADESGQRIIEEPDSVIKALTWSESTFNEAKLEQYLLANTADQVQFNVALKAVLEHPELVVNYDERRGLQFTSQEIVAIEARLIALTERMASSTVAPVSKAVQQKIAERMPFNPGQRAAFELLCGDEQIAAVNGAAGTGKSYVLAAMREAYEREGYAVRGAILQGKTAEDLERDSGIKSRTIAQMLIDIDNGKFHLDKKTVLVIDEAGMVGSRQLERLMYHAELAGARVRLVGDAKQLAAVEYGNAFVEMSERVDVASLTEIMRQREEWMRQASEKLAVHDISALRDYHDKGRIQAADTIKDAQLAIVNKWVEHRDAHPEQSRIVLSHTNASRLALNDMMRAQLKADGELQTEINVNTSRGVLPMAIGEQVMFTRADKGMGVKNGTTGVIKSIGEDGRITVELLNGKEAQFFASGQGRKREGVHVDYGYAVTVHKSQGMTVDKAFVLAENSMTLNLLYVSMTRHRGDVEMTYSAEQFETFDKMVRYLDRAGEKAFSVEEGREWLSAQRPEDSVIGQMLADINAEKVIKQAAQSAKYKEIAANLDPQRVLDYLSKSHGLDVTQHEAINDEKGRPRIQTGDTHLDVAGFLTRVMHLDYKTQAAPILKQCYGEQLAAIYSTQRYDAEQGIDQVMKAEFTDWRKLREAKYKADKERLDAEKRTEKTKLARAGMTVADYKLAYAELSKRIKADKAALKASHDVPEAKAYKAFLVERAPVSERHLKELWRVAVTPEDKAQLAAIEKERAIVRERAKEAAQGAIADATTRINSAELAALAKAKEEAAIAAEAAREAARRSTSRSSEKGAEVSKAAGKATEADKAQEKAPEVPRKDKDQDLDHGL